MIRDKDKILNAVFKFPKIQVKGMYGVSKSSIYNWLVEEGYSEENHQILQKAQDLWILKQYNQAIQIIHPYRNVPIFQRYHECLMKQLFQVIKQLVAHRKLQQALQLTDLDWINDYILSQKIAILTKQGRFDEVLFLCADEALAFNGIILSQKITALMELRELEEALSLCTDKTCQQNAISVPFL